MKYTVDHIPRSTPNERRSGLRLNAETITIHNTGNAASSARNERDWLTNPQNSRQASFHLVVDDTEVIECLPLNENAWHAGDGYSGPGNRTSIAIEICESGNYTVTLQNAASLVAKFLRERGWGTDRLRRHWDWSRKICPRLMYDGGAWTGWKKFVNSVQEVMDEMKALEAVEALQKRVEELEARVEAPEWFVNEFGSADLNGLISDPKFTLEGWRTLAVALRAQK